MYEEEVESRWRAGADAAAAALPAGVAAAAWAAPLFESYADTFAEWKRINPEATAPLEAPEALPPLSEAAAAAAASGELPPAEELLRLTAAYSTATTDPALRSAHPASRDGTASEDEPGASAGGAAAADGVIERFAGGGGGALPSVSGGSAADWDHELASELASGEGPVMEALGSYLRHVETAADGGGGRWHLRLAAAIAQFDSPAAPDACFPALFGRALALGVVSRRRVHAEAAALRGGGAPEWAPPAGLLARLGYELACGGGAAARLRRRRKAAAASAAAEAAEFHLAMARRREGRPAHGATLRHWRWRGGLADYLEAVPAAPLPGAPAVLLVHGFGAFGEQWRGNAAALAAAGLHVYCPTLPGYGRAEKPAAPYGQDLWRDYLVDFVVQVVRRPVVAAGNSIGGFIAASMAADAPGAAAGLVLVNSAGGLTPGYAPPASPPPPPAPPRFVVEGVSAALFKFLEGDVANQLKRLYPARPARADAWLAYEITRAAGDPGALGVFRSVFYLPKPRALNYLVADAFGGPALVLQGALDPLNDAVGRARGLAELCPNARVVMLQAGHCPHDEVPEEVNRALEAFVREDVMGG
jgi:pimeloyl-ACP methyl ester carboxylesterase